MKVTSRGRPDVLLATIKEYVSKAYDLRSMKWMFTFDFDDDKYIHLDFQHQLRSIINGHTTIYFGKSNNKIHAINRDVENEKEWDILLNISDDQIPIIKGYDEIIRTTMPNSLDASLWFNDGHQSRINTQEILGRTYYDSQGYIYDKRFKSFFCDNLSTLKAKKEGKLIQSNKCIIKHFHPGWQQNSHVKRDELYIHNDRYWNEDKAMFEVAEREL